MMRTLFVTSYYNDAWIKCEQLQIAHNVCTCNMGWHITTPPHNEEGCTRAIWEVLAWWHVCALYHVPLWWQSIWWSANVSTLRAAQQLWWHNAWVWLLWQHDLWLNQFCPSLDGNPLQVQVKVALDLACIPHLSVQQDVKLKNHQEPQLFWNKDKILELLENSTELLLQDLQLHNNLYRLEFERKLQLLYTLSLQIQVLSQDLYRLEFERKLWLRYTLDLQIQVSLQKLQLLQKISLRFLLLWSQKIVALQ